MAELKSKNILLAGGFVLLLIVVWLVFKLLSGTSLTNVPPVVGKSTETMMVPTVTSVVSTKTPVPATKTLTPPPLDTPTPAPTFAVWTGRVNVDKLTCRSGPGAPYTSLAVLTRNNSISVIGRDVASSWLFVNFESKAEGLKECWVEAKPIDLRGGDVASLENYYPGKYQIPFWGDYKPPENVRISRSNDFVNILWDDPNLLALSERQSARSPQFILEAWVCRDGVLEFKSLGVLDNTTLIIEDQPGCPEPSSGQLYSAGKHGYSIPVDLQWPAP